MVFANWRWPRIFLVGPLVFLSAFLAVCGASVYLPAGPARIDNVAIPLVLFPAIWALLFFYSYLDSRLIRAYTLVLLVLGANLALVLLHISGGSQ
ncbi:MAG: hypothetical protein CMN84_09115 [Spongiibacteraceae bacterium]|jgi:hypothetical protein|nr:hypothetical protein [Spongiibacteraceae bacterium]